MSDFFQTGTISTLHRLGKPDVERLENELREFTQETPIALVLPCHIQEVGSDALKLILKELRHADYLTQIIIGIDGARTAKEWRKAREVFSKLPQETTLLWNDGTRMKRLFKQLSEADLDAGSPGKGRNLWICFGYVLASEKARMIAVHDCDIITYNREMLARLCYPVAHPSLGFDFCKGYSARFTDKLNGRAMRLMFTPLMRSLQSILGSSEFLTYMDAFRYPLSGEVSFNLDIARRTRIPSDWGVEAGMLAEVYRVTGGKSICQAELSDRYDHKHQDISTDDPHKGLHKMVTDIAKSIFLTMAAEGIKLDAGLFDTLLSSYMRQAEDSMRFYGADAAINGLRYDRHDEELAVATFVHGIRSAAKAFLADPLGAPLIPNWNRVQSALPEFFDELNSAVELDNA